MQLNTHVGAILPYSLTTNKINGLLVNRTTCLHLHSTDNVHYKSIVSQKHMVGANLNSTSIKSRSVLNLNREQ